PTFACTSSRTIPETDYSAATCALCHPADLIERRPCGPDGPGLSACARPGKGGTPPEGRGDAMDTRTSPGELRSEAPAWQRVWLDSYPCDQSGKLPLPHVPVSALLETAARRFPDHVACTLYGKPTTFGHLNEQAHRLAHALHEMGAGP